MAILATERVLTLDYWKPAHQLAVGDYVFDKDGKPVRIKLIQQYRSEECYEVIFNDHLSVRGDKHLKLPIENKKYRTRTHTYKQVHQFRRPLKSTSVDQLLELPLKDKRGRLEYSVPTTKPLELPHQDLPVPPFILGFWFFARRSDKTLAAARGHHELVEQELKDHGYSLNLRYKINTGERVFNILPSIESQLAPNIPTRIPNNYLLGSAQQRIDLLRGILVAKNRQYSQKYDKFRFSSYHKGTVLAIQGLVESLGCRSQLFHDEYVKNYTLFFKSRLKLIDRQASPPIKVHQSRRYIKHIEKIAPQLCVHIETTGKDNSIVVGEGFIACL